MNTSENQFDTTSAEENQHQGETQICIRIDLQDVASVRAGVNPLCWSKMLTLLLSAALRATGVLVEEETVGGAEDGRVQALAGVLTHERESIGMFWVTDWQKAVPALIAELEVNRLLQCANIAYRWKAGPLWMPAFPERSTENFDPIAARFAVWIREFHAAYPVDQRRVL